MQFGENAVVTSTTSSPNFIQFRRKLKIFWALHILAYASKWHYGSREKKIQKIKIIGKHYYNMQNFKFRPHSAKLKIFWALHILAQADSRSASHSEAAKKFKKWKLLGNNNILYKISNSGHIVQRCPNGSVEYLV